MDSVSPQSVDNFSGHALSTRPSDAWGDVGSQSWTNNVTVEPDQLGDASHGDRRGSTRPGTPVTPVAKYPSRRDRRNVRRSRRSVAWYWKAIAWCVAIPLGFVVTAVPVYWSRFVTKNDLLNVFVGTGSGRYVRLAIVTVVWAFAMTVIVTVVIQFAPRRRTSPTAR